ncbi:MAG: class I SAM-dependent methyltransferase [Defluviitaleaceae bacterium]|nr:class I SAM-dependent methyltransferase [Defluviitaleaceae bacterium]
MEQYDSISAIYDNLIPEPLGIFDYYSSFINYGNEVLDLGCGTGRLSFVLAEKGANVTGIDISSGMINVCNQKLETMPKFKDKVKFEISSATNFISNKKFDFIFMPGGVFEHLLTPLEQKSTLENIKSLLKDDGLFVFDIITPITMLPYSKRKEDGNFQADVQNELNGKQIKFIDTIKSDHFKQIIEFTSVFEIYDLSNNLIDKHEFKFITKYTLPNEMEHLLNLKGFNIINFYGGYNRSPFKRRSEFMVYECNKIT